MGDTCAFVVQRCVREQENGRGGRGKVMDEFTDCGNGACKRTCICKANGESALLGVVILPFENPKNINCPL